MRDTVFRGIALYSTSEDRQRVEMSNQMKLFCPQSQLVLLTLHKQQLESDLMHYNDPYHMKKNNIKDNGHTREPTVEELYIHLEITTMFISQLEEQLFDA